MSDRPIYVTQPHLPPLEEVIPYLEEIWGTHQLTNKGPFHEQLESALCEYLGVGHISLFANGTLALVTAMQALRLSGEVITTPYSFVATANALLWNDLTPVFVDVDPVTLNLDAAQVEAPESGRSPGGGSYHTEDQRHPSGARLRHPCRCERTAGYRGPLWPATDL